MPVLNIYEGQTQLGAPADQRSNVHPENGGAMALAKANAGLADTISGAIGKFQEQIESADVMKANNEYNLRMGELRDKLYQNKESNAQNNMELYEEGRKKIIGDILKKGPRSIRYGNANKMFFNMTDRDWVGQHNSMLQYVAGETEKYHNTEYVNQLKSGVTGISENYMDDNALEAMFNRGDYVAMARFYNYGPEKIRQEQERVRAANTSAAVTSALAANNYDRAGELLQSYGKNLTPQERQNYDKVIQQYRQSNNQLTDFASIYGRYGKNISAGMAALPSNSELNRESGKRFWDSIAGQNLGPNQCANTVTKYLEAVGADPRMCSSLADGMQKNSEDLGLAFNDRGQLRDGDLVFWSTSDKYAASENAADVNDSGKAYHGTTHVGVYDARSGKVMQAGTHGVGGIDIDTYPVTGYAHVGGREYTPVQRQKEQQEYIAYVRQQEALKQMQDNYEVEQVTGQMYQACQSGTRDPQQLMDIARNAAGNDPQKLARFQKIAQGFATGEGNNSYKLSPLDASNLEDAIDNGVTQKALYEKMKKMGCDDQTIMKYISKNRQAIKKENEYKYNWNELVAAAEERMGKKVNKETAMAMKEIGKTFVKGYPDKHNNRQASNDEVIGEMYKATLKDSRYGGVTVPAKWFGYNQYSQADLYNKNIYKAVKRNDGSIEVYRFGDAEPVVIQADKFREIMEDKQNGWEF